MTFIIIIALIWGVKVWALSAKKNRIRHQYYNAVLRGEEFTEVEHANVKKFLES